MLEEVDSNLLGDIKRIFVFGREGDAAFFITKNDHVYAYGRNRGGCLGLGTTQVVSEPKQVVAYTRRRITEFAAGRSHVLAMNKVGQVFACGSNEYGQLGLPNCIQITLPQPVNLLRREKIVAIACGAFHSLVLTARGEVLAFGFNFFGQLGVGDNDNRFEPVYIANLRRDRIVEIACGQHHSVVLSRAGDVLTFGHNSHGQLGTNDGENFHNIPMRVVHGAEVAIKQITCGQNHVLAVADDGRLIGFGANYYGQLGTGSRINETRPVELCKGEAIDEIVSSPFSNTSVARTRTGTKTSRKDKSKRNSLVFGQCGDHWLLTPLDHPQEEAKTKEEAFLEVQHMTPKTAIVKTSKKNLFLQFLYMLKKKVF